MVRSNDRSRIKTSEAGCFCHYTIGNNVTVFSTDLGHFFISLEHTCSIQNGWFQLRTRLNRLFSRLLHTLATFYHTITMEILLYLRTRNKCRSSQWAAASRSTTESRRSMIGELRQTYGCYLHITCFDISNSMQQSFFPWRRLEIKESVFVPLRIKKTCLLQVSVYHLHDPHLSYRPRFICSLHVRSARKNLLGHHIKRIQLPVPLQAVSRQSEVSESFYEAP